MKSEKLMQPRSKKIIMTSKMGSAQGSDRILARNQFSQYSSKVMASEIYKNKTKVNVFDNSFLKNQIDQEISKIRNRKVKPSNQ